MMGRETFKCSYCENQATIEKVDDRTPRDMLNALGWRADSNWLVYGCPKHKELPPETAHLKTIRVQYRCTQCDGSGVMLASQKAVVDRNGKLLGLPVPEGF